MAVKVDPLTEGFRLRYRGVDVKALVRTPRLAQLAALMPEKTPPVCGSPTTTPIRSLTMC
jgi:propionyl-CoA carboxylase alpha chain